MRCIITSKTRKGNFQTCVGAICLETGDSLRLLESNGTYPPSATPYRVGDIWDITFIPAANLRAPHLEDVIVTQRTQVSSQGNLASFFLNTLQVPVWRGRPNVVFGGCLGCTGTGSGFVSASTRMPRSSTGFWIPDRDLSYRQPYYWYPSTVGIRSLRYVGFDNPISVIPAGTLVRVSLAKWWHPNDVDIEDRCYLQLSGWYI